MHARASAQLARDARTPFWKRVLVDSRWRWLFRFVLAFVLVMAAALCTDIMHGAMNGWMRWRLENGNLLSLSTGVDSHQATLRGHGSVTTVIFDAVKEIASAECR